MSFIAGSDDGAAFGGNTKDSALIWLVRLGHTGGFYGLRRSLAFVGYEDQQNGFDGEDTELVPQGGGSSWTIKS